MSDFFKKLVAEVSLPGGALSEFVQLLRGPTEARIVYGLASDGTGLVGIVQNDDAGTPNNELMRFALATAEATPLGLVGEGKDLAILGGHAFVPIKRDGVIRRLDLASGRNEVFAGKQNENQIVDGALSEARFGAPVAIAACNGDLYVAESEDTSPGFHVIRHIDLDAQPPTVSLLAGSIGAPGHRDGPGLLARFDHPVALACDGESLYVADQRSHVIRQIVLATGTVSTLVGAPYQSSIGDGTGTGARLSEPAGIAIGDGGDLFITSAGEGVVQRVE